MARENYDLDESVVRTAAVDEDAEWQRVNSYIADVLKDCYVLFAKLARLRGDFAGDELASLDGISAEVRDMGQKLATFSKAFTEGKAAMSKKEQFGQGVETGVSADFEPTAEDFDFSVPGEGMENPAEGGVEVESEPALEEFGESEKGEGEEEEESKGKEKDKGKKKEKE